MILEKSQVHDISVFYNCISQYTVPYIYVSSINIHTACPHIITSQVLKHQVHEQEILSGIGVEKREQLLCPEEGGPVLSLG